MSELKTAARLAGLSYLGLAITGMLGFLLLRPMIFDPADAAATATNLVDKEVLARLTIALELGVVLTQALAAIWFFKLFRLVNPLAAGSIAAFGLVNAIIILVSSAAMVTALKVALTPSLAPGGDVAATVQLLFAVSAAAWQVGMLFFGLWLIPMGYVTLTSNWMPKGLGYVLMVGGVGYMLSCFATVLLPANFGWVAELLPLPATVGEFWMIFYLLIIGVRPKAEAATA